MSHWLSSPIETLLQSVNSPTAGLRDPILDTDFLIIGSGYGAAMAALALAERSRESPSTSIAVFERGEEYLPDDFPKSMSDLPGYVDFSSRPAAGASAKRRMNGLWDIRSGEGISVVAGNGLGGTSLVNANVAERADQAVLDRWPAPAPASASWSARLQKVYPKIEALLGVSRMEKPGRFAKFNALRRVASSLGGEADAAPLTINFAGPTQHSADHGSCNNCGNCVLGCHSGAKGSLNMNAWPLSVQLGVKLYTGVTVSCLQQSDGRWKVTCQRSRNRSGGLRKDDEESFFVMAGTVILAAGTLGSAEILHRSRQVAGQVFSARLGERFSANGDALMFGVGQARRVNPLALVPDASPATEDPNEGPGPTIIGRARLSLDAQSPDSSITLEDGAVPFPLIQLWKEIITTQSFLRRYESGQRSVWHQQNPAHDYLAVSQDLAEHSQILLAMGIDEANGVLRFDQASNRVLPEWRLAAQEAEPQSYYHRLHDRLSEHSDGFDGGEFHAAPTWQLLGKGFAENVEGAGDIQKHLVSVHPLGGCCMAETADTGVVNTRGQVFSAETGSACYGNLYVLDGSIVPGAVGTNPFLTIAALAYTLAAEIPVMGGGPFDVAAPFPPLTDPTLRRIPRGAARRTPEPASEKHEAVFSERLIYAFDNAGRSLSPWAEPPATGLADLRESFRGILDIPPDAKALVLDISFHFADATALNRWIENPAMPVSAALELKADRHSSILSSASADLVTLATMQGQVVLGRMVPTDAAGRGRRMASAVLRHFRFRNELSEFLLSCIRRPLSRRSGTPGILISEPGFVQGWWRTLRVHTDWRELRYQFQFHGAGSEADPPLLELHGSKTLGYGSSRGLFAALMVLPVRLRNIATGKCAELSFEVDSVGISEGPAPLQLRKAERVPEALLSIAGVGAYFLRVIMQTHFWSFAAPSYSAYPTLEEQDDDQVHGRMAPPPEYMNYGGGHRSRRREAFHGTGEAANCRLVRYQPEDDDPGRRALLLIHGLAHSSRIFWTDTIEENYVQYFLAHNYDVWILDHRTSASTIRHVTKEDTWDDIALHDVPWAVATAYETINAADPAPAGRKKLHIFAHCIGAGAASIAVLQGKLTREGESMVASLVPHAVTPWLYASVANRARENIWGMVKNFNPLNTVEPRPHQAPSLLEIMYDRLASAGLTEHEKKQWDWRGLFDKRGPFFARMIYTRYTIFWGRQWVNSNITAATRKHFTGMIGAVPAGVLQQVYFSITHGMLAEHRGKNSYVRQEKFARHWTFPTLFLHGDRNTVFDMESSRLSADQLARLRILERTGRWPEMLAAADYADNDVWIDIVSNYGHMDMIFGRNSARDICPRLDRFFRAADEGAVAAVYRDQFVGAEERFHAERGSRVQVARLAAPLAGPVISRPHQKGGRAILRVWCEAQDYSAVGAQRLQASRIPSEPAPDRLIALDLAVNPDDRYEYYPQEFLFHDYVFDPCLPPEQFLVDFSEPAAQLMPGQQPAVMGAALDWGAMPWYRRLFLQQPDTMQGIRLSFLAGSCVHPGSTFERELAYSIFEGMFAHVAPDLLATAAGQRGVDHVLLLGDQIYADATAGMFDPGTAYERFRKPHRRLFSSRHARKLFAHVPTFFAVDDHEFNDNHDGDVEAPVRQGQQAVPTLESSRLISSLYQIHQPPDPAGPRLWYDFTSAGYPFFIFDTRLERSAQHARHDPRACITLEQQQAFEAWLSGTGSDVLFIATGSPLGPVSRAIKEHPPLMQYDDSLLAYPGFVDWLAGALHGGAQGKTVYWLCGDPHFSCTAQLLISAPDYQVSIVQVCASGLYAPYAFANANPNAYFVDGHLSFRLPMPLDEGRSLCISGSQRLLSASHQHFLRIDLVAGNDAGGLAVQAFGADGLALSEKFSV